MAEMDLQSLREFVDQASAIRTRVKLQPAGGEGDKLFPPTYVGGKYALEERTIPGQGQRVTCVLLDSVQSQANRIEEALQRALDEGRLMIPVIEVDFSSVELIDPISKVTSLQAPHRIADAILRDSEIDGVPFRKSEFGRSVNQASLTNATSLFEICPTALIFGMWDSTGPKGGLGAKFQRCLVSEIIGYDVTVGKRTSSRIDPLQIRAQAKVVKGKDGSWVVAGDKDKSAVSPSEINHSNIPPDIADGGVTVAYAEQICVLSLPALRRLRFPLEGKTPDPKVDLAARTTLAALSLCGAVLASECGFDLRSRCLLWPNRASEWEVLGRPGTTPSTFVLTSERAIELLNESVSAAQSLGLMWRTSPIVLSPSAKFAQLVRKSQELAATDLES